MLWLSLWCLLRISDAGVINDQLAAYQLHLQSDATWSVKKSHEVHSGKKTIRTLYLESSEASVELTLFSSLPADKALLEAKADYDSIRSAYRAATTPYAGAVSRSLSCPKEFVPKEASIRFLTGPAKALVGYASERKTFGVCHRDEARTEFAFVAVPLPDDRLLKLTAFRSRSGAPALHWQKLFSQFKLISDKQGGTNGAKAKSP